jgi:hypothetical protein
VALIMWLHHSLGGRCFCGGVGRGQKAGLRLTCGAVDGRFNARSIRTLFLVDEFFRAVSRDSQRTEEQIALEVAVKLDLPIVSYEMPNVRWDDLDSVTLVGELSRRGYSAIGVDVEIRRLLRHHDLLMPTRLVETKREFFGFGGRFPGTNRTDRAILRR